MSKFSKLVAFIETYANGFPFPEWAIFCEAGDLGLMAELENAFMVANNNYEFSYVKLASYFTNH